MVENKISLLIVDDHPIFRNGLKQLIEKDHSLNIVCEAGDGISALNLLQESEIAIAVSDVDMPNLNGIEVLKQSAQLNISTQFIFLTMYKDESIFNRIMDNGARGFVLKENAAEEILLCVHSVIEGNIFVSNSLSEFYSSWKLRKKSSQKLPSIDDLTPTERKILHTLGEMKTSKEIAREFFISEKTVENHRTNISCKLELHGMHALIKFAVEHKTTL
ncbi:MAG: response regulator transcription factor [Ignavibacteriales bacterium]|nr:response regulator transcription factor [Ignavibacteriales bacterium]